MKSVGLIICLLLLGLTGRTQQITVHESLEKINDGLNNAIVVEIPAVKKNDVSSAWRKLMKGAGAKVSGKTNIEAANVKIPLITTDTLFVFTSLEQKSDYVRMVSGFRIRNTFITSVNNPAAFREAERIIQNFALNQARSAVQVKVDVEKNKLNKLETTFKKLDADNKKLSKNIEDYTSKIQSAQATIEKNEKQKEKTSKEIEEQRKSLETVHKKLLEIK